MASNSQRPVCLCLLSAVIKVCVTIPGSEPVFLKQALQLNNHYQGLQMPTELIELNSISDSLDLCLEILENELYKIVL